MERLLEPVCRLRKVDVGERVKKAEEGLKSLRIDVSYTRMEEHWVIVLILFAACEVNE